MLKLFGFLVTNLLRRKGLQAVALVSCVCVGAFTTLSYQNFLHLQAQNISMLSVYNEIVKPLIGLVFIFQALIVAMVTSQLAPYLSVRGQHSLLLHSPLSDFKLATIFYLVSFTLSLIPLIYFCLIIVFLSSVSQLDSHFIVVVVLVLIAGAGLLSAFLNGVAIMLKNSLIALIVCLVAIGILFLIDEMMRTSTLFYSYSIFLNLMLQGREGLIVFSSLASWLIWLVFFLIGFLLLLKIKLNRWHRKYWIPLSGGVLLIVLNSITQPFSAVSSFDVSSAHLNSLSEYETGQIESLSQEINITAVIDNTKNHDEIKRALDILRQYHKKINVSFTNRQALGEQGEQVDQFVTVQIGKQQQSLRYPFDRSAKDAIAQLIIQLEGRSSQWITFIEGHEELGPFDKSNRGLSAFYQSLRELGWPVAVQNLSKQAIISNNTQVLIIAASRQNWLNQEIEAVLSYLEQGGNLVLLREDGDRIPAAINEFVGIKTLPGTLIDWHGYQSGTPHPAIVIVNDFPQHPINTGISSILAFPWSKALNITHSAGLQKFEYQAVIETHKGVWTEFDVEQSELSYDAAQGEMQASFTTAFALKNKTNQQRILVVGDSSFLSDSAINNYKNKQFALNIISWLSSQNTTDSISNYSDSYIKISPIVHFILLWGFSIIVPLGFVGLVIVLALSRQSFRKQLKRSKAI
ncbi:MAG: GldG family protein [Kangiellaceae bacterium]|nr:GldG family protein [Kangiellaceae bacterium]